MMRNSPPENDKGVSVEKRCSKVGMKGRADRSGMGNISFWAWK